MRFHGRRVVERFLARLASVVRQHDSEALVTYGNFPPTEFLQLGFLDFLTLNVYLLDENRLGAYLDRALIQARGRPLLLGEVGDDSLRRGLAWQAEVLDWTIPLALDRGVCGVSVFSWTDDWGVGGMPVEDWRFGLVAPDRSPKPSLAAVSRRFHEHALARRSDWPRVSVVVCTYNGAATLAEALESLLVLEYPDYEVIYVDDGSTDDSLAIARRFGDRIEIQALPHGGLSVARNAGAHAASGAIVAYIDSDAYADPNWLRHLVLVMQRTGATAVGGPNLTPLADGVVAQLIATCPGNPTVVLKDDVDADHLAGVNLAIRRDALLGIGGFDPIHRRAGDDVDVCWRLMDVGLQLAYAPAAVVWHHRRPSIRAYLRQQFGYGEAEAQLAARHPERFSLGGGIRWNGRVYATPRRLTFLSRPRVYHGYLGTAMFQTVHETPPVGWLLGPRSGSWYAIWSALLVASPFSPWLVAALGIGMATLSLVAALVPAVTIEVPVRLTSAQRVLKVAVIGLLHFLFPVARGVGRIMPRLRLSLEQRRMSARGSTLRERCWELRWGFGSRKQQRWFPTSRPREEAVVAVAAVLRERQLCVAQPMPWDDADVSVGASWLARARVFSTPDFYPAGLRWGVKTAPALGTRVLLPAAAVATGAFTLWWIAGVAALLLVFVLVHEATGRRAVLRRECWTAIELVMERSEVQPKGGAD